MKKKIITLVILGMFLSTTLTSSIAMVNNDSSESEEDNEIFESEIRLEGDTEIEKPINHTKSEEIEITVKYKLNIENFAKWFFFKRRIGRMVMFGLPYIFKIIRLPKAIVNLSIIDKPSWCEAELKPNTVEFDFDNVFKENTVKLTFSINKTAPALEESGITIEAEFKYIGNGSLKSATNTTTISFLPEYLSELDINATEIKEIPPAKKTIIPINITNKGNGETILDVDVVNPPENWNISIDPKGMIIPVDNESQINLVVIPPKGFDEEIIDLTITPRSTFEDVDDKYLEGDPQSFSIILVNDGSLKVGDELGIDTTLLIIIIVVIILILIAAILLKRKK